MHRAKKSEILQLKRNFKNLLRTKKNGKWKKLQQFQYLQISGNENDIMSISRMVGLVENGEVSSSIFD